jgi:regulator of protease activity HflC (stomatin/prohibitin superfamily)
MTSQNNLFGADEAPIPPEFKGDLVAQARKQATSLLQREFAKLLGAIEQTGSKVQTLEQLFGVYRAKFGQVLPPLKAQQESLARQMVVFLHERLQRPDTGKTKSLTASNRKAIGRLIVSLSAEYAMQGDTQMRTIHDQYSNESIDEMDAAQLDEMLDLLDEMGVELDVQPGKMSPAELAQAALKAVQEKMAQQQETEERRKAKRDEKRAEKAKLKAKADPKARAKLAEKEQAAQEAQHSLRHIYRQLARQLHPDRADNDAQRALNHDLMSEANTAYERQDLLALLKLQLKAQQIDASAMSTVAEDKLKGWVSLLREQYKDLASQCLDLQMQISHEFRIPVSKAITAAHLEQSLTIAQQEYDEVIHLMRSDLEKVKDDAFLKRWSKANSKALEQDDMMDMSFLDGIIMDDFIPSMPRRTPNKKR